MQKEILSLALRACPAKPTCAMYYATASIDLLLPRLPAGQEIDARDVAEIAEGGFRLACSSRTFPHCPFGK